MSRIRSLFTFRFKFTKDTAVALISGIAVILLSSSMYLYSGDSVAAGILNFVILDFLIRTILGFALPMYYILVIKKEKVSFFGIKKEKSIASLIAGIILAGLLLMQFLFESGDMGSDILLKPSVIFPILYILVSGIFEMVFIYGFLRKIFEESFGIIPGILLTAVFYSFHHAGFQPEFFKLFFVGIMYASVFRITNNILIVFPFYWGVGAVWDVLVNFGTDKLNGPLSMFRGLGILLMMIIISIYLLKKNNSVRNEKEN